MGIAFSGYGMESDIHRSLESGFSLHLTKPLNVNSLDDALRHWLLGTLVCMIVVGTAVGVGLALIGVPFAAALGLLAFLLEFIPYLGPIVAAIPGVLVAASADPRLGLYALALYVGVQVVENWLLSPIVYQRVVHLPAGGVAR